jgi:hypothetical protein
MEEKPGPAPAPRLKEAMRQARVEIAERTAVVVDLRNAEIARLELLNEALDPVFAEIPPDVELFDRGLVSGDPPRLWIDMIAHVVMGRDKRIYRFLQDTRYGRRVLAESGDIAEMAAAVTKYVARRLVERERLLEGDSALIAQDELTRRGAPPPPLARVPGLRCRTARRGRDSVRHRLVRRAPAQPMSA